MVIFAVFLNPLALVRLLRNADGSLKFRPTDLTCRADFATSAAYLISSSIIEASEPLSAFFVRIEVRATHGWRKVI